MGLQNFHIVQTSVFHVPKTSGLSYFFHVSKATHHKQGREKNGEEKRKNWAGESWAPPPRLCGKREEEGASPLLLLFSFILSPFFFFALSVFPPLPLLPLRIHLPTSHSRISPPGKKTSGWRGILGKTISFHVWEMNASAKNIFRLDRRNSKKCSCACEKEQCNLSRIFLSHSFSYIECKFSFLSSCSSPSISP